MINEWHGYPQHPDAHPERPWWRKMVTSWERRIRTAHEKGPDPGSLSWLRDDGAALPDHESLEAYDTEHPLPAPEPRCGQVWVSGSDERMVTALHHGMAYLNGQPYASRFDGRPAPWPPPGAVLVAGPGSPWAPMGDTK